MIVAAAPSPLWYLSRGTGAVTLVLLTATVVLGIAGTLRWRPAAGLPRFLVDGLHRNLSLLVVVLLAAHVLTAVLDPFAHLRAIDAVVPLASAYRPLWLGFGALALDLLIALVVTSLVRARLGLRAWRAVHWVAYACWPVALLHGLGTGTDASAPWLQALARSARAPSPRPSRRARALAGLERRAPAGGLGIVAATLAAGVAFAVQGPLQPGVGAPRGHARRAPRLRVEHTLRDGRAASYDREGRHGPVRRLARRPRAGAPHRDRRGAAHPRPDRGGGGAAASRHAAPRPSARERRPRDVLEPGHPAPRRRRAVLPRPDRGAAGRPGRGPPHRAGGAADPAPDGAGIDASGAVAGTAGAQELVG